MSQDTETDDEKKPIPESTITMLKTTGVIGFFGILSIAAFYWFFDPGLVEDVPFLIPLVVLVAFVDAGTFWYIVRLFRKHNASLEQAGSAVQRTER